MSAKLVRLRSRDDRLQADQAAQLRSLVMAQEGLPSRAVRDIVAAIDQQTASASGWTFVMLSPTDNAAVVDWLVAHSRRPQVAVRLWAHLFRHLRRDTGEIVQSRGEIAEFLHARVEDVSRIMTELEGIGAVSRRRERIAGMRGPGVIRYYMSPRIGTHQTGVARDQAQESFPPLLRLVEGNNP